MPGHESIDSNEGRGRGTELARLDLALAEWVERGRAGPLRRWLERELDRDGVPRRLEAASWWTVLDRLALAFDERREPWPGAVAGRVADLVVTASAMLRPDGTEAFRPQTRGIDRQHDLRDWASRVDDPRIGLTASPRFGRRKLPSPREPASQSLREGRPVFVLRERRPDPDATIAVEDRGRSSPARFDLFARGRHWLGPGWSSLSGPEVAGTPTGVARLVAWQTGPKADYAEWTFLEGKLRVTRTVVVIHGHGLALLAEERRGPACLRLDRARGVSAEPDRRGDDLVLRARGATARLLPIGSARLDVEEDAIVLRHTEAATRCWLPLLVCWEPSWSRRAPTWRPLTVSERQRRCPPDRAFAARVSFGRGTDSLVLYRSLTRPAPRAFLGHPTTARFLVGLFNAKGDVVPLLSVEGSGAIR